jgi:hypothetical protein
MDEIALVAAVAPPEAGLPAAVRDAARGTLLAEAAAEQRARTAPDALSRPVETPRYHARHTSRLPRRRRPRERERPGRSVPAPSHRALRWGFAGAALAAIAVSAAITLPGLMAGSPAPPTRQRHAPATAAAVLLRAAQVTAATPDLRPRPDQFVFKEAISQGPYRTGRRPPRILTRDWLSADGMHGGLTLQRYLPGKTWVHGLPVPDCSTLPHSNWNWKANCPLPPAYVMNLPRTLAGMKDYLVPDGRWGGKPGALPPAPPAAGALEQVISMYQFIVPHRTAALMFRALSTIKGIHLAGTVTTLAGRKGIATAAVDPFRGIRIELIFDPNTYQYIGDLEIAVNGKTMHAGTEAGNAVIRMAVVGKAGELP